MSALPAYAPSVFDDADTVAGIAAELRSFAESYERHGANLAAQPLRDWAERLDAINQREAA